MGFGNFAKTIFEQMFGGRGGRAGGFEGSTDPFSGFSFNIGGNRRKGRDILYDMELSLEDVLRGKKDEIELQLIVKDKFKQILDDKKTFIKEKTGSKKIFIENFILDRDLLIALP